MQELSPGDPHDVGGYRLLRRLGAGGMGQVYLGISPGRRLVAVKVIRADQVGHPEYLARFRREVLANRLVSGAFTAPVIDHDTYADPPWLATAYVPGPSLSQAVQDVGPLPESTVTMLAGALSEALLSIHQAGLVHRDLKPGNVLLAEDGPRVIDFGIARIEDVTGLTKTKAALGTHGYIAPEFLQRGESTAASDMFALGGVLTYAAAGTAPFGTGPPNVIDYRTVHEEPQLDAVADSELRSLVADCLAKDPATRPTPQDVLQRTGFSENRTTFIDASVWAPAAERAVAVREEALALVDTLTAQGRDGAKRQPGPRGSRQRKPLTRRAALITGAVAVAGAGAGGVAGLLGDEKSPPADKPDATPLPNPVSYWPLDSDLTDKVRDEMGRNDGVNHGATKDGEYAYFDGLDSYIQTAGPVVRTGPRKPLTVAAMVKVVTPPPPWTQKRMEKDSDTAPFYTVVSQRRRHKDVGAGCTFYLQFIKRKDGKLNCAFVPSSGHRAEIADTPENKWMHVTGVYAEGKTRLYIDGIQKDSKESRMKSDIADGFAMIGGAMDDGRLSDWFPGYIRDVRIYDQSLSADQIKRLAGKSTERLQRL